MPAVFHFFPVFLPSHQLLCLFNFLLHKVTIVIVPRIFRFRTSLYYFLKSLCAHASAYCIHVCKVPKKGSGARITQMCVSCLPWVLTTEPRSSARTEEGLKLGVLFSLVSLLRTPKKFWFI